MTSPSLKLVFCILTPGFNNYEITADTLVCQAGSFLNFRPNWLGSFCLNVLKATQSSLACPKLHLFPCPASLAGLFFCPLIVPPDTCPKIKTASSLNLTTNLVNHMLSFLPSIFSPRYSLFLKSCFLYSNLGHCGPSHQLLSSFLSWALILPIHCPPRQL